MDVNDFRKHAIPAIEAGKKVDAIRQAIKSERYADQDRRESLKETFKPVTDKLEEEIGELTDEIKDLKMLPALGPPTPAQLAIEEPSSSTPGETSRKTKIANPNAGFTPKDLDIIESYGLKKPSDLVETEDPRYVEGVIIGSANTLKSLGGSKGTLSKKKKAGTITSEESKKLQELNDTILIFQRYGSRVKSFPEGFKTIEHQGSGLRRVGPAYTQPKRNAYKIAKNGKYRRLMIDLPRLLGHLRLTATKDGKEVFDKIVDFGTIDLLTKRFNGKKKYSPLSRLVFDELNILGELPIHKTSKKYSKIGSGVVYYRDTEDLSDRLELLGGSIKAGNDSARNEFSAVAHTLHRLEEITTDQLKALLGKYVNLRRPKA